MPSRTHACTHVRKRACELDKAEGESEPKEEPVSSALEGTSFLNEPPPMFSLEGCIQMKKFAEKSPNAQSSSVSQSQAAGSQHVDWDKFMAKNILDVVRSIHSSMGHGSNVDIGRSCTQLAIDSLSDFLCRLQRHGGSQQYVPNGVGVRSQAKLRLQARMHMHAIKHAHMHACMLSHTHFRRCCCCSR